MPDTITKLYKIQSWLDGSVLFSGRFGSLKLCVEAAVIARVSLVNASLDGARLVGASLDRARLDGASLVGASLVNTSLDGARLVGASLVNASLDGASLVGARLYGASLVGARLDGVSLYGASDIIMLGQPDGWQAYAYRAKTTIRVQIGCRNKTIAEGREYWTGKDSRREVLAALNYAEAVAALRGWTFEAEG